LNILKTREGTTATEGLPLSMAARTPSIAAGSDKQVYRSIGRPLIYELEDGAMLLYPKQKTNPFADFIAAIENYVIAKVQLTQSSETTFERITTAQLD
jgi:hypothetical protein